MMSDPLIIRQSFIEALNNKHSTIDALRNLYMSPLPEEIGPIQCMIRRDQSGVNRFSPKYYLLLQENGIETNMLLA